MIDGDVLAALAPGRTPSQIAAHAGVDLADVYRTAVDVWGSAGSPLVVAELRRRYQVCGQSIEHIGRQMGMRPPTVRRRLVGAGVTIRPPGRAPGGGPADYPEVLSWEMWQAIAPLIPPPVAGRPGSWPADPRAVLEGLVWIARGGVSPRDLPAELFGVRGATCERRLLAWRRAGVWPGLYGAVVAELRRGRLWQVLRELEGSRYAWAHPQFPSRDLTPDSSLS